MQFAWQVFHRQTKLFLLMGWAVTRDSQLAIQYSMLRSWNRDSSSDKQSKASVRTS